MYEYGLVNVNTNERTVIFGRSYEQARSRSKLDFNEWELDYIEYID